jgi:small subunit ribosomal protein S4
MIIGPKYKIARRLNANVFEKTQTQKFALSSARKGKNTRGGGPRSDYGKALLEKQKARYSYALTEKQFSNYVKKALSRKGSNQELLFQTLEGRLDNVVVRAGFATTRLAARQMVSHGHITVNGKKVSIPSYQLAIGDVISIREGSKAKALFNGLEERLKNFQAPSWLAVTPGEKSIKVNGLPTYAGAEMLFDMDTVLEFYNR